MRENFKGFTIRPFLTEEKMFDEAEFINHSIDEKQATVNGFIYKHDNRWWDTDGAITGLEYIL